MSVVIKLFTLVACGIVVTAFLMFTADLPNKRPNGFQRSFLYPDALSPETSTQVSAEVRQIISLTSNHIYLSTDSPGKILVKDRQLENDRTIHLALPDNLLGAIGNIFKVQLDSSRIYVFASNIPAVVLSSIHKGTNQIVPVPGPAFSYGVALSENSFIFRQFLEDGKDKHFVKYNAASRTMYSEDNVSLQSADGGLSTDGQLHYDRIGNRLLYMHYYNNTIASFDTNLVLISRFHTIDTISSRLRLGVGAPLVSNQKSCVYKGLLLVCSNLKADNETFHQYRNSIPVDTYEIATGFYKGSFYLPLSNGKLVKSMKAYGNSLATLYHDNRLSLFKLPALSMPVSHK